MEKLGALDREAIIGVLGEGRGFANELKRKLDPTTDSREACDVLLENILSSYENAIKLLDCMAMLENGVPSPMGVSNVFELPNSIEGSHSSEGSDLNSKDLTHKSKKRKTVPKWSEQVRVRSDTGFEGHLDDGYNWRKYGQKDILGATHPRAYYRCTHRNTQGCLATKQVQRADEDSSIFEVIYRGKHSCMLERLKHNRENIIVQKKENDAESPITITTEPSCLKAENQELVTKLDQFPSFSFPSTPIESENLETRFFSETSNFIGTNYSSHEFYSPATSDSYFSLPVNDFGNDFAEIISNPTPFTNLSFGDLDISFDQFDFSSQLLDAGDYF
ncbi:probable WRKY transcription factor 53 [Phtheirospermum japonicum]|uniref:Probable WRKY transcription factor 53 n=1 Tax=Phtheirospermum japonicum TaxID=374723 RepID=A0A830C9T6_9LAMI|nr:probable WRKY transcription factor 53 [Phtheirospermum japonicum]